MGIELFLPDSLKTPVLAVLALMVVLSSLAGRYSDIEWMQFFRMRDSRTDEQKVRARRSANLLAGAEMIMMGFGIPLVYGLLKVVFFSDVGVVETLVVGSVSVVCIALGIWTLIKERSSKAA